MLDDFHSIFSVGYVGCIIKGCQHPKETEKLINSLRSNIFTYFSFRNTLLQVNHVGRVLQVLFLKEESNFLSTSDILIISKRYIGFGIQRTLDNPWKVVLNMVIIDANFDNVPGNNG